MGRACHELFRRLPVRPAWPVCGVPLLLLLASCATHPTIRGRVVDQQGKPLRNSSVETVPPTDLLSTPLEGRFQLQQRVGEAGAGTPLAPGRYVLRVRKLGYEDQEIPLEVGQGQQLDLGDIVMKHRSIDLEEYESDAQVGGLPEPLIGEGEAEGASVVVLSPEVVLGLGATPGTERYERIDENPFTTVQQQPLSTFSIDVDTASYTNVRRYLSSGSLPPAGAVRIEELLNYFGYDDPPPRDGSPFAARLELGRCPWEPSHLLVRLGLKGAEMARSQRPPAHLVFLLDVSGSMDEPNKLPLLKRAMKLLVTQLGAKDKVSIVVYAGASGLVLPPTPGEPVRPILEALDRLGAGGSTNGGAGIELAYALAAREFVQGGINRVILATDGDFNVGTTSNDELTRLIEEKAKTGVFLSVLGFGSGNLNDSLMEQLADRGNGAYAYLDTFNEARRVLVEQVGGTLVTLAKDVKIQVEFNPARVQAYRLIGYENRMLRAEDFKDDTKDAGEIGAGHSVTALYEIVPPGVPLATPGVDPLKYQQPGSLTSAASGDELMTLKIRFKKPDGETSAEQAFPLSGKAAAFEQTSPDFRFAAAVAAFGMLLRSSPHLGPGTTCEQVLGWAEQGKGPDRLGYRQEFIGLVRNAQALGVGRK